jgi:hypothetical protein
MFTEGSYPGSLRLLRRGSPVGCLHFWGSTREQLDWIRGAGILALSAEKHTLSVQREHLASSVFQLPRNRGQWIISFMTNSLSARIIPVEITNRSSLWSAPRSSKVRNQHGRSKSLLKGASHGWSKGHLITKPFFRD